MTLLHIPQFQEYLGEKVSLYLSDYLDTKVEVGSIELGLLNQTTINDVIIYDHEGNAAIKISKASSRVEFLSIFSDEINLSTVNLYGMTSTLSRRDKTSDLNIQFLIDKLKGGDTEKPGTPRIHLNNLIVRNGELSYNDYSVVSQEGLLDVNHLNISDLNLDISLINLHPDSLDISLKELTFTETKSNFSIYSSKVRISSDRDRYYLHNPSIQTGNSIIESSIIEISKPSLSGVPISIYGNLTNTTITPADFAAIIPLAKEFTNTVSLSTEFHYSDNDISLQNLLLSVSDNILSIDGDLHVSGIKTREISLNSKCRDMSIETGKLPPYLRLFHLPESTINTLSTLGTLNIKGVTSYKDKKIATNSIIELNAGCLSIDGIYEPEKLTAHLSSPLLSLSEIIPETGLRDVGMDMDVDLQLSPTSPSGLLKGTIHHIGYKDYDINNISIDGQFNQDSFSGLLSIHDREIDLSFNGLLEGIKDRPYHMDATLSVNHFSPATYGLKGKASQNSYDFTATADLTGSTIDDITGFLHISDLKIQTPSSSYALNEIRLDIPQNSVLQKQMSLTSDIGVVSIVGMLDHHTILATLKKIPSVIIPGFGSDSYVQSNGKDNFQFSLKLNDHPFLHSLLPYSYEFSSPINIEGNVNSIQDIYSLYLKSASLTYDAHTIDNLDLHYQSEDETYHLSLTGNYSKDEKSYDADIQLSGKGQEFSSTASLQILQEKPISGKFKINGHYNLSENRPMVRFSMSPSTVNMENRQLNVQASSIEIDKERVSIRSLEIANEGKSLTVNGILSEDSTECLTADLNGSPMGSIFELLNTKIKNLDGYVYGKCNVYNILSSPKIDANMTVQDLKFKDYLVGNAYITANWDNQEEGIRLRTQIIGEDYSAEDRLALIDGYIFTSKEELELSTKLRNIDATILEKLIGRTFKSITGKISADVGIRGPFKDVQIIGSGTADATLTLRATNVGYKVSPEDKIGIRTNSFEFDHIHVTDKSGHRNVLNGRVGHTGFKDFSYTFDMEMDDLLVYEETNFNNDKFKGTIYADGRFHLDGSDGHPLRINADITPSSGSEFSYDAATPDAITGSNFLQFDEKAPSDSLLISQHIDPGWYWSQKESLSDDDDENLKQKYRGDIFMDIGIRMNHNCPVKLRMDNVEDGYITTYGTGDLQAEYHNKGSFTLNGTYKIDSGKYRLYLQDIIYRDLLLQNGSQVVFNGNPFDADIHLICWYTLNSVPLTDLTSVTYTQNNRIKVICELDITGKLGNMAFNFDLNLPNVSDETRQIVRSYISTEEEMNKQMIYLLGFGRFFTNEYARVNGETNTNQAVNNLLSSTLSGQLNQMLTNAIGSESKWNIGTGLSTGERGWEDMDVEGNLSGRLLDDRLLINGNFGYRDNSMTNTSSFVGDVDVKWRLSPNGNTYLKAYNLTNDRYFTKSTLNTQGIGATYQKDFESWKDLFRRKKKRNEKFGDTITTKSSVISPSVPDSGLLILQKDTTR